MAMDMTKREVSLYLGKSVRTIERLTSQGKLGAAYRQGSNGEEAVYDSEQVRTLKEALEIGSGRVRPLVVPDTSASTTNMARVNASGVSGLVAGDFAGRLLGALESLRLPVKDAVPLADKLTLNLAEASALAGLSKGFLMVAVKSKKLKAAKRGRGWNVKRSDLDIFVSKL
jgi:excisionase family DNA binding protein